LRLKWRQGSHLDKEAGSLGQLQEAVKAQRGPRAALVDAFAANLETSPGHDDHKFVYGISGQAGAGKSFLVSEFLRVSRDTGGRAALADLSEPTPLDVLRTAARQLGSDEEFAAYFAAEERREKLLSKLASDPDAPDELSVIVGGGVTKGLLTLGSQVPGLNIPLAFVDDDAAAANAEKLIGFLRSTVKDEFDFRLASNPVGALTPLFVDCVRTLGSTGASIVLLFDAFERTSAGLEKWILNLLGEEYGRLPIGLVVVVAGQQALSPNRWRARERFLHRLELDVFSEDEAILALGEMGITDPDVVARIVSLSGRLPILLAMLAARQPSTPEDIDGLPAEAIEVFLEGIVDGGLRDITITSSLLRLLNEDVVDVATGEPAPSNHWDWLRHQSFVQESANGWRYHEVARRLLQTHKLKTSPDQWRAIHERLRDYFNKERWSAAERGDPRRFESERWCHASVEATYHRLCADRTRLANAVILCVVYSDRWPTFALDYANAIRDAGADTNDSEIARWGTNCIDLIEARTYENRLRVLDSLVTWDNPDIEEKLEYLQRRRGRLLTDMGRFQDAMDSFLLAIQRDDSKWLGHVDLAIAALQAGQPEEAIAAVNNALERIEPAETADQAYALCLRAGIRMYRDELDQALEDASAAVALSTESARPFHVRGQIYVLKGDIDSAVADFRAGMARDLSYEHEGLQEIGTALANVARYEEARRALVRSLELSPNCAHCWRALISISKAENPDLAPDLSSLGLDERMTPDGLYWRAQALGQSGYFVAAVKDFEPSLTTDLDQIPADTLLLFGLWLTYVDRFADAITAYREVLRRRPGQAAALYDLAVALAAQAGPAAVQLDIAAAREALYSLPDDAALHRAYGLGGLAAVEQQDSEAFAFLAEAVKHDAQAATDWATKDAAWRVLRSDERFMESLRPQSASSEAA
jgi:tetratricopeptide (TPR) repeat protein